MKTLLSIFALTIKAHALVSINWVTVEDTGSTADTATGYGLVEQAYRIGRHETTIAQYVEFLNSTAKTDPYGLYNPNMATDQNIAGIARSGNSGDFTYSVIGNGNRPVTYVSWFDAARFANWMHNGQVAGGTETGAYNLNGSTSGIHAAQSGAAIWIPTENQWYKAAYHVSGTSSTYWSYPTSSSSAVSNSSAVEGVLVGNPWSGFWVVYNSYAAANFFYNDGVANSYNAGYAVTESPVYSSAQNYLTPVGSYTGSTPYGSVIIQSPHGTFDQGGNVWEWNEAVIGSQRGIRGGAWDTGLATLSSANRSSADPLTENSATGFRLASIATAADIALEAPAGTVVSSGSGSIGFGATLTGQTTDRTLVIRNDGGFTLNGISATVNGPDSSLFTLLSLPSAALEGGTSTSFTIRFSPTTSGSKTATLSIVSNDPDENPFTLTLTGTGNTTPTFAGYSVATAYQTAATISLSKLLTKAADADGDALSVTAAGPASAQGGTAVLQSGSILYTPPAAFSGTDTFSVTIADAYGASVSGTVTVGVAPNPTSGGQGVNPPQITMPGNGTAVIASQGIPGRTYMVQRSTNLSNWFTIGTVVAASNGAVSFIDTNPPVGSAFYRLGRNVPEMNFWGNGSDGALTTTGNISFASVQDGDVVVKQFTNLTINAGHTLTTSNRCRGLVIYVNGDCTINGTLSMTARGASVNPTLANSIPATGIRLARFKYGVNETLAASDLGGTGLGGVGAAWRAAEAGQLGIAGNGRIFTIAREGGAGGDGKFISDLSVRLTGGTGFSIANGTGGGGGGGATGSWSGFGSAGTCYSGGSGGGGACGPGQNNADSGAANGGQGGNGNSNNINVPSGGGAGNPGGLGLVNGSPQGPAGQSGTGGLLLLFVKGNLTLGASGVVSSHGSTGGNNGTGNCLSGGGSGGGRIIILHAGTYSASGVVAANGGSTGANGGMGGSGAVTIDRIDP